MNLIYEHLWESTPRSTKDVTLRFPVVPHKYGAFAHHLETGHSPSDLSLPSVPGPFLRYDEEIGRPREIVDVFKTDNVDLSVSSSRSRATVPTSLGLMIPMMLLYSVSSPLSRGLYHV